MADDGGTPSRDTSFDLQPDFLPPFANAENKELYAYINNCESQLERTKAALDENKDRVQIMQEHLKNVQQELVYTQSRVDSKNKEIETEDHLKQLGEREVGRLQSEVKKLEKEQAELEEKMNALQNQVYRGNEKMDQFKLLMNWNQEELEQWALASRQKEEDNLAYQKYSKADQARIKELNLHIEKMTKEVAKKKVELETEVTETQSAQIQLDKTAEDFRMLHTERMELVRQWDEAVEAMKKRDEAIEEASERFAQKKLELRQLQMALDSAAKFLDNEQANNREIEAQITLAERGQGKLQMQWQAEKTRVTDMQDEVEVMKNTLAKAANDLTGTRNQLASMKSDVENKKKQLESVRKKFASVKRKLEGEFTQLDTLEKRTNELLQMQKVEEEHLRAVKKEVAILKDQMFKSSQELFQLRTKERDLIAEIAGGQSQNKNLTGKIAHLDQQVVKQQELLYQAEFSIQQMERKVARAGGERSDEEKRSLNVKIEALSKQLEGVAVEYQMLIMQVKRAEDDLVATRRKNSELTSSCSSVDGKISELRLECETAIRVVKESIKEKEDKMVAHDVMKLEVKRLRDILNLRADEVYGLENRKYQLQMSMEERKHEVEVHGHVLRAELRAVQQDLHRATLEMKERMIRVEKLQGKHQILSQKLKGPSGEDEGDQSQAYYVIKAAQEREMLQRQGDELDAQIRKAEKEVRALENTLAKLNEKNGLYRGSFRRVEDGNMLAERAQLRERLDRVYDKMKFKRNEERSLMQDIEQLEQRLNNVRGEEESLHGTINDLSQRGSTAEADWEEQVAKSQRASRRLGKLQKDLRVKMGVQEREELPEELDLSLQGLKETNRDLVQAIRVVSLEYPNLGIAERFESAGIKLPSGNSVGSASSRGGSRAPSDAGSVASGYSQQSMGRQQLGSRGGGMRSVGFADM